MSSIASAARRGSCRLRSARCSARPVCCGWSSSRAGARRRKPRSRNSRRRAKKKSSRGGSDNTHMSVFEKHKDALEAHETMMGAARGRLAVALDLLTDSLALVGQHGVYCRSERFPGRPRMDVALVLEQLEDAKQLVQTAMEE